MTDDGQPELDGGTAGVRGGAGLVPVEQVLCSFPSQRPGWGDRVARSKPSGAGAAKA